MSSDRKQNTFNLRPVFFCFFLFALGIAFGYLVYFVNVSLYASLAVFLLPALMLVFQTRIKFAFLISLLACLFFFLGMLYFLGAIRSAFSFTELSNVCVRGTVTERVFYRDGYRYELSFLVADKKSLYGKAVWYSSQYFQTGDVLTLTATVKNALLLENGGLQTYRFSENIRYAISAVEDVSRTDVTFSLSYFLRERIQTVLFSSIDFQQASVFLALATGNTSAIEEGLLSSVRYGGVAHLFAVSGLHVGIVYGGVFAFLKRIKSSRVFRSFICLAVSLFYVAVCGYSASALRAFLMCSFADLSFYIKAKRDFTEIISLAGILLLLFRPAYLFSVGYQLSFAAVLGISVLQNNFTKAFQKIGIRQKVASALSATTAVNVTIFPIMLDRFGYVSVWGFVLNFVFIPLLSLLFAPMLVLLLLSVAFPVAANVFLWLPGLVLKGFCFLFEYFDFSSICITGFSFGIASLPYYMLILFLSDRLNISKLTRITLSIVCLTATIVCVIF